MLASQTPLAPYVPGANGSKTGMIASYRNGTDDAYTYTYDANGNIVSIAKGSLSFTYTYDAANQLVRENLYYGSGNSNNATYTYEYDAWGNILNKKEYAYTTGTLGTVQNTVTYGYTNTQWGDLLTSVNGVAITYDAMGNMATYGNKTYAWEGKQLVGINVMGVIQYSFAYDENGLRTRKTMTAPTMGTEEITEYYYNGTVLIGMYIAADHVKLRFSYDASGNVVAVDYSEDDGTSYTTYYYLRNAQNDIVKIVDSTGSTVVEYIYDSWGKLLSVTGSLSSTLGADQPFRYRGYVCDDDLGLYYLQSRYYDPTICRFISADVYLSTGQGVIGHNSFAYCLNNPVALADDAGTLAFADFDENSNERYGLKHQIDGGACGGGIGYYGSTIIYYNTMDEAAIAFAKKANYISMKKNIEVCAFIFETTIYDYSAGKYVTQYYLSDTYEGEHHNVISQYLNHSLGAVGFIHTHPYCDGYCVKEIAAFSSGDCFTAMITGVCYMSDCGSGRLFKLCREDAISGLIGGIDVYLDYNKNIFDNRITFVCEGLPTDTSIHYN